MNSWQIIKQVMISDSSPGTLKRLSALNTASDIFLRLSPKLKDKAKAEKYFCADSEVTEALCSKASIQELKKAGVL